MYERRIFGIVLSTLRNYWLEYIKIRYIQVHFFFLLSGAGAIWFGWISIESMFIC